MFKAVSGAELSQYDEETRQLYAKRESDWRLTDVLMRIPRSTRNYLPVVTSPDHPTKKAKESYLASLPYQAACGMAFFVFAQWQLSKAYYPYGIILRRSIPTSPMQ